MVFWYFSDCYCVEFLIVHVFDNKLGVFDSYDDTYVSVVGVISVSFELYNRSYSRRFTSWYSFCFCIPYPLICISSPGYILVLCDIGGTVSPGESSIESCISNFVCFYSRLCWGSSIEERVTFLRGYFFLSGFCGRLFWSFCKRFCGWFFCWFISKNFLLILFILSYKTDWLTCASNDDNFTNRKISFEELAIIRENAWWFHSEFCRNTCKSVSWLDGICWPWYWWNFYDCSSLNIHITCFKIICPKNHRSWHAKNFGNFSRSCITLSFIDMQSCEIRCCILSNTWIIRTNISVPSKTIFLWWNISCIINTIFRQCNRFAVFLRLGSACEEEIITKCWIHWEEKYHKNTNNVISLEKCKKSPNFLQNWGGISSTWGCYTILPLGTIHVEFLGIKESILSFLRTRKVEYISTQ